MRVTVARRTALSDETDYEHVNQQRFTGELSHSGDVFLDLL